METEVKTFNISTPHSVGREVSLKGLPVKREGVILEPNGSPWESKAVLNAGVVSNGWNDTLLYRAFGDSGPEYSQIPEGQSSIGLATISSDGTTLIERLEEPVIKNAEDLRIVDMGGWYAATYTKVTGFEPPDVFTTYPAIAITRNLKKFRELGRVKVKGLKEVNKNVVLFPEKIRRRYASLVREKPDIFVVYSDDLLNWDSPQFVMGPRKGYWDSEFIGPCGPPIKTPYGWLEIYHGVDKTNRYALGVVLLDLDYPFIVLGRSIHPILEPTTSYEINGQKDKPLIHENVVYSCGQTVREGILRIYYGAADQVIASATINMDLLLKRMMN